MPSKLLLAGSTRPLLARLESLARERLGMEVLGPVPLEDLETAARSLTPDAVIATLPARMAGRDGRHLAAVLRACPNVVVIGIDQDGPVAMRALLLADDPPGERVIALLRAALPGVAWIGATPPRSSNAPTSGGGEPVARTSDDDASRAPYSDAREHVRDEIDWIRTFIPRLGLPNGAAGDESGGSSGHDTPVARGRRNQRRDRIDRRVAATPEKVVLRLELVGKVFQLTPFERAAFVLGLALRADPGARADFARGDRGSAVGPTTDDLLRLFTDDVASRRAALQSLASSGGLRAACLLLPSCYEEGAATWTVDPAIADFVLEGRPAWLPPGRTPPAEEAMPLWADPARVVRLAEFLRSCRSAAPAAQRSVISIIGPPGPGRSAVLARAARQAGLQVIATDAADLLAAPDFEVAARRVARSCRLYRAALFVDRFDRLLDDGADLSGRREALFAALARHSWITVLGTNRTWIPGPELRDALHVVETLSELDERARTQMWEEELAARAWSLPPTLPRTLATKFRLDPCRVRAAAREAEGTARYERCANMPSEGDLHAACRSQAGTALDRFASRTTPVYRWDDLVLSKDATGHLREIVSHVRNAGHVLSDWRFREKHARGNGIAALFSGPSGTGKTMAAEVLANDLGLDLWRIDLSRVVSKYVGETEERLREIFDLAEENGILFFDEADALFGKRTEIRDAHDRYANVEVAYLLQRMEEYDGISVLATNLRRNLDEAFVRRMRFIVEFAPPDRVLRERIWRQSFPENVADPHLDFAALAARLDVSGGVIRSIALRAAFLAADAGSKLVLLDHVIDAAEREFEKLGRPFGASDFAPGLAARPCPAPPPRPVATGTRP